MRVVVYARVSSVDQEPQNQLLEIRAGKLQQDGTPKPVALVHAVTAGPPSPRFSMSTSAATSMHRAASRRPSRIRRGQDWLAALDDFRNWLIREAA